MSLKELTKKLKSEGFPVYIIRAFQRVKRENFVPAEFKSFAYDDIPLPIGLGQTMSQPSTIAFMLQLLELKPDKAIDRVLEVGSGSGFALALLHEILKNAEIFGAERIKFLSDVSSGLLADKKRLKIIYTPKGVGLPQFAPFDRILVSAAAQELPRQLIEQMSDKGILVCPVKNSIWKIKKVKDTIEQSKFFGFSFVPLIEE